MTQITEAVYMDGMLKPLNHLELENDAHVRVIVQSMDDALDSTGRRAAIERFIARADSMKFNSGGHRPSRDELHDRI